MSAQLQLFESRDATHRWNVRVSRRARRLSVRVYPGGCVEVVVPPGASPLTIERFVGTHRKWIEERVADLSTVVDAMNRTRPASVDLRAIGRRYLIQYKPTLSDGRVRVSLAGEGWLMVSGDLNNEQRIAKALRDWLLALSQRELARELEATARRCGLNFRRMQIRRQRTRWGSCSASGTISLNMCVLFQDPAVMRYLLVHELCHTRHMNHSRRFWALVESFEPDYRRLDRELLRGWQHVPAWMFT